MFKGGMAEMLKQAQQVQENMKKAQEELAKAEVTGSAGADLVKLTLNGIIKRNLFGLVFTI